MSNLENNLEQLNGYLKQFQGRVLPHRINGADVAGSKTMDRRSPVDDSVICQVAEGSVDDIDAAAKAAKAAFPAWRDMPGKQRRKILHAVADAALAGQVHHDVLREDRAQADELGVQRGHDRRQHADLRRRDLREVRRVQAGQLRRRQKTRQILRQSLSDNQHTKFH